MTRYTVLILLWGIWCFLHSFLITPTVTGFVRKRFGNKYRYYRIFYNFIAVATLIPVLAYSFSIEGQPIFRWEGPFRIVQGLLVISALLLFIGGARIYDFAQFIGIRQARENNACGVLTDNCRLEIRGVLEMIRHPWYAGGILIVWARDLDLTGILTGLFITGYFFIGTLLEERKLLGEFGEEYIDYRKHVSMLFPFKWIMKRVKNYRDRRSNMS